MAKWSYIPLRVMTKPRGLLFKVGAACRWIYFRNTDCCCTFVRILGWQRIYPRGQSPQVGDKGDGNDTHPA